MHPILFELGGLRIGSYALFVVLGWSLGGSLFYRDFRRRGWPLESMLFVMAGCTFGAVIGSVLVSALFVPWEELPLRLADGSAFIGRTVLGGIAGGFLGVELIKKLIGYPHSTGDAFALAIPLGHALGRVGCFLHGCCFGTVSSLPWSVRYPAGSIPHAFQVSHGALAPSALLSLPVHPTPLYELGFDVLLFFVLLAARSHLQVRGSLFRLYLVLYAGFRFFAELVRGDSLPPAGFALKPVQMLLLAACVYYAVRLYRTEPGGLVQVR